MKQHQIHIGVFNLGHENVDLFLVDYDSGGAFYFQPDDKGRPRIKVGYRDNKWHEVVDVLVHEAMEFLLTRANLRYRPSGKTSSGHDGYLFVMNHDQFTEAAARLGLFLVDTMPKMAAAYNKATKGKK